MTGAESGDGGLAGAHLVGGAGDESRSEAKIVSGIPPRTPPPIRVQTYIDPFPVKKPLTGSRSGSKARVEGGKGSEDGPLKEMGKRVHVVKKVQMKLGSAASFKRQLEKVLEAETEARPGVPVRQIMAEMLVDAALGGDKWAFEQVLDRTEGKPAQTLDIGKKASRALEDLPDDVLESIRAMAARQVQPACQESIDNSGGECLKKPEEPRA